MVRAPFLDKNGIRKGAWSQEEDDLLRAYVQRYGHWNWRALPKFAGLSRCGKSCRLRWMNYLRPGLKRGNYSKQEEDLIIQLHNQFGNKWSKIAEKLPGRSDNEIKNYWHTNLKKQNKQRRSRTDELLEEKYLSSKSSKQEIAERYLIPSPPILESSSYSTSSEVSNGSCDSATNSNLITSFEDYSSDELHNFWTQPFVPDQQDGSSSRLPNLLVDDTLLFPNYEDSLDLFYQIMHELPPN